MFHQKMIKPLYLSCSQSNIHTPSLVNTYKWSYANLQMLQYAVSVGKLKYDRTCYMIRSKAFKAYKEG